jgi:hypothetical protein
MKRKYFIFIIALVALVCTGILSGNVYPLGHHKDMGGPGGYVQDCNICHDFVNGYYENPPSGYNLRWVRTEIKACSVSPTFCSVNEDCPLGETCIKSCSISNTGCNVDTDCPLYPNETCGKTVKFVKFSKDDSPYPGVADGTLADGPSPYDGPCEVCHTAIDYHTNNGTGAPHFDAQDCTVCHLHFADDIVNYFQPYFVGGQSHYTHFDDPKGPQLGSGACFTACHKSPSNFKIFKDDKEIADTTVCDACHSPKGFFDGVPFDGVGDMDPGNPNSVAYGAKFNWEQGIYEPVVPPAQWPSRLKAGKEQWCAGCHDRCCFQDGSSVIKGVSAPNVMGDNVTYGYNVSGHGRNTYNPIYCLDCHDATALHTDGKARTYKASSKNYQSGYRLKTGMAIPRYLQYGIHAFDLCFQCHIYSDVFGPKSNFRNDLTGKDLHETHLGMSFRAEICWDSDWSGGRCINPDLDTGTRESCDSAMSCTACHNVHGSPCLSGDNTVVPCSDPLKTPMIRHGELISTPGTSDKVPALRFNWYKENNDPTTDFDVSRWGGLLCGSASPSYDVNYNHVCWGCHSKGEVKYYRAPGGAVMVTVNGVWTADTVTGDPESTFNPGGPVRYNVSFTINGPDTYYVKAIVVAKNTSGTDWQKKYSKSQMLSAGDYEWMWNKTIPSTASHGSSAKVTITVKMFDSPGGTLIHSDKKTWDFNIQ